MKRSELSPEELQRVRERDKKYREKYQARRKQHAKEYYHLNKEERKESWQQWKRDNPTKYRANKRKQHYKTYGLSPDQVKSKLKSQDFCCAICGKPERDKRKNRLCIDHNHETGAVRGMLCSRCNAALGFFEDDPALLKEAIRYLRRHQFNGTQSITTEQPHSYHAASNTSGTYNESAT